MNNPLRALATLFTGESPPPATADVPPIKVEVPADVAEAASLKPKVPRESFKQHNREVEQRVKTANLHRPVMITRSLPHARGR